MSIMWSFVSFEHAVLVVLLIFASMSTAQHKLDDESLYETVELPSIIIEDDVNELDTYQTAFVILIVVILIVLTFVCYVRFCACKEIPDFVQPTLRIRRDPEDPTMMVRVVGDGSMCIPAFSPSNVQLETSNGLLEFNRNRNDVN